MAFNGKNRPSIRRISHAVITAAGRDESIVRLEFHDFLGLKVERNATNTGYALVS